MDMRKKKFYNKGGEALAQVARRGDGWPNPVDIQSQAGTGSEQPVWAAGVAVNWHGVGIGDL